MEMSIGLMLNVLTGVLTTGSTKSRGMEEYWSEELGTEELEEGKENTMERIFTVTHMHNGSLKFSVWYIDSKEVV